MSDSAALSTSLRRIAKGPALPSRQALVLTSAAEHIKAQDKQIAHLAHVLRQLEKILAKPTDVPGALMVIKHNLEVL